MITHELIMRRRSEALVVALVGNDLATKWWNSANAAFEGHTPEETWKKTPDVVYQYLMGHAGGGYL
jgi:hypothetical protein